jgi:hypothetical protein
LPLLKSHDLLIQLRWLLLSYLLQFYFGVQSSPCQDWRHSKFGHKTAILFHLGHIFLCGLG